jgi:hypothetical protein
MRSTARFFLLAVPLLAGCFVYVPADPATIPAGEEIRIFVSRVGMAQLPIEVASNGTYLNGRFEGRIADSVRVRVPVATRQVGFMTQDLRQEVRVPAGEVVQFERRELSRGRTALLVAGGVAGGAAVVALISGSITGGDDPGPGDDLSRIPLLSIPVP